MAMIGIGNHEKANKGEKRKGGRGGRGGGRAFCSLRCCRLWRGEWKGKSGHPGCVCPVSVGLGELR